MLRRSIFIALVVLLLMGVCAPRSMCAPPLPLQQRSQSTIKLLPADPPAQDVDVFAEQPALEQPETTSEMFPIDGPPEMETQPAFRQPPTSLEEYASEAELGVPCDATSSESFFARLRWLGLRHSSRDGRNAGMGMPLVGTSWLNRPYYLGVDLGTVWLTRPIQEDVVRDTDMYGGIYGGCDFDYYWGAELAVQRATPELINESVRDAYRGDRMMIWTANVMYYPWGDSVFRPYWRSGIGGMEIDFPTDEGYRRDEVLWTFPIGIGIKYPVRRWLAARAEFTDQIGVGNSGVNTQHDLTLTFALEWRFGGRKRSYWPWNPSSRLW